MEFLIEEYLTELSRTRSPATVSAKANYLKHLLGYVDTLVDFDSKELARFYEYLKKKGLKESSIKQVLFEVRRFYRWLRGRGFSIEFSASLREVFGVSVEKKRERRRYTDEEIELVLRAIRGELDGIPAKHPIYYLLTTFLVSSGLRISEALALKKRDISIKTVIDEEGNEKEVWLVEVREGKFGKSRTTPVFFWKPVWRKMWEEWVKRLQADDYIFTYAIRYPKKTKIFRLTSQAVHQFFYRLSKELRGAGYELKATPHRFRYTYITKLGMKGVPVSVVSRWVGHEKITTTLNIYMEVEEEKSLEIIVSAL